MPTGYEDDKTGTKMLDMLLKEQQEGIYRDPTRQAQKWLTDRSVGNHQSATMKQAGKSAEARAGIGQGSLEPVGPVQSAMNSMKDYLRPMQPAMDIAREAAFPAAFAGGGAGLASAAYYGANALGDMVEHPSGGNALALGLSVLPAWQSLRRGFGAAQDAGAAYRAFQGMRGMPGVAPKPAQGIATAISHNEMPLASEAERLTNRFVHQTPEVLDAAETVAAPGFSLGPVTPMDQVPTSKALRALQQAAKPSSMRTAAPKVNEGSVAGFTDLTPEEIAAAEAGGYTYGQGIPESVLRRR